MEIKVKANVNIMEAYNIFVDDEKVLKVRGNKVTTLKVSDDEHTLQLNGSSGKSSVVKISKPHSSNDIVSLEFNTDWACAFKEGYFKLVGE